MAKHISLSLGERETSLRRGLYGALARAVMEGLGAGGRLESYSILDVGCGRGELLEILGAAGYDVFGIDMEPACVEASSRFGTVYEGTIGDVSALFQPGHVDAVVCSHVLEHLRDPLEAVTSLLRLRARLYVFAVPNLLRPARIIRAVAGSSRADHPHHLHGWGRPEFAAMLTEAGLRPRVWYADRVTVNPLPGAMGLRLTRLFGGLEERLLPKIVPQLASSLLVACVPSDSMSNPT